MRTIDADALKDKARELIPNYHASVVMNLFDLIDNLADNMPTVDAEPVRHEQWARVIYKGDFYTSYHYKCSECGEKPLFDRYGGNVFSDYCPNCGAKMDGGEVDEL